MTTTAYLLADRAGALANYPHARRAGDYLFVSGISSRRADNSHAGVTLTPAQTDAAGVTTPATVQLDISAQTRAVLHNIEAILTRAGAGLADVVDCTVFLVDMADYAAFNTVYNTFFDAESGPTRTTVAVHQLPHPHLRVELKVIAYQPQQPAAENKPSC